MSSVGEAVSRAHRVDRPQRVVVVGASLAGLFAAAAASGAGRMVTVLERDRLPETPRPRSGVPQGRQPHVFLYRGLLAVDQLLPGFRTDLLEAGAVSLDTGDLAWLREFGWAVTGRREFEVLSATRPLFEHVVLTRVRALPGVLVRDGSKVESVRRTEGDAPWSVRLADGSTEPADLLVDASGRSSRMPAWLSSLGIGPATVSELDARVGYATREYAVQPGTVVPAGVVLQQTPRTPVGGLALPVEGGRWLVGAIGTGEQRPSRDATAFGEFLDGLRDPGIAEIARSGEPLGEVRVHRQTANLRHHYERLRDWPDGLLVLGDALCAFNPIYGQGVTVAACEAVVLREALHRGFRRGEERRLLRQFTKVMALPWAIATGEDRRYTAATENAAPLEVLFDRWTRELGRLAAHRDDLAQASLSRVYHLMAPAWLLVRPGLLAAAVRARLRGYHPPTPRPQIVAPTLVEP